MEETPSSNINTKLSDYSSGSPANPGQPMFERPSGVFDVDKMKRDGLETKHVIAYSISHFANDLCAAQWFVYLSWYIKKVVGLDANTTGLCLLSGQIADGITTPIVGILSDKIDTRWGKRMPWFYFGFIVVIPCFAGIFLYPPWVNGEDVSEGFRNAWYITLPALFNVGWASVQISSMSIVNQLTYSNRQRDTLSNNRNGLTYAANITVLAVALVLFLKITDEVQQFQILCGTCLSLGFCTSMFYMCTVNEIKLSREATRLDKEYKIAKLGEEALEIEEENRKSE